MDDALVGRTLLLILATIIGVWFVKELSWEKEFDRFMLRFGLIALFIRGVGMIAFELLGLFPLD